MNPNQLSTAHEALRDIPRGTAVALGNLATLGRGPDSIQANIVDLPFNPQITEGIAEEARQLEQLNGPKAA